MMGPLVEARILLAIANECTVQSVTGGIEPLLGFPADDLLSGRIRLQERFHREDAEIADRLFSPAGEVRPGPLHLRLRAADGRIRCVVAEAAKRRENSGAVVLDLLLQDARGVAEPEATALASSFATLIDHTRDLVYIKNRHHVLVAASRALVKMAESARSTDELLGKTDYDLFPEELADISYRSESRVFAEGRRVNDIVAAVSQSGQRIWFDDRKYPLNDSEGAVIGIFGLAADVTAEIEVERGLRDAQEIAGLGSFSLDLRTSRWSPSAQLRKILGIGAEPEEGTLEEFFQLMHPEERQIVAERLQAIFAGQAEVYEREYRILRQSDGAVRWVFTRGRIERDAVGGPAILHGTVQDVTEKKQAETALRESKELLQLFIEHAPAGLAMLDREMHYLAASQRWKEMYDLTGVKDLVGRSHYELFPDLKKGWKQMHRRALAGEAFPQHEVLFTWGNGRKRWVRREVRPWYSGEGQVGGIVIFSEDISAQKETEERLRLAAGVFTNATEGILITNAQGNILEVNQAFTRITGYTREQVLGKNPRILQSGVQTPEFYQNMWESLLKNGHWAGEIWNRTKGGEIIAEKLSIHAVRDPAGKVVQYVAHFSDITQLKEQERQLEHVAHYDALTGLPNRSLLADRLRQAMAQAHRRGQFVALAYLDLDGFKSINQRYGQETGDNLLTAFAKRMNGALREGDSLARLGGDEFAAVMLDLPDAQAAGPSIKRLLQAAAKPVRVGARDLRVTASIGVAIYPAPEDPDADQLLRQAGQAMYQAKLAGRNRYAIFDSSQDLSVQVRSQELERLMRALAHREFVLHFQPKVNMRTGAVVGAEALIRWQHPERGLLLPGQFLPTLENHPLSIEVGEWVIETALAQIEAWQKIGLDIPVSVNLGALQLQQKDFTEQLRRLLAAHPQVKANKLELEVLETSALQDLVQTSSVLEACRAMNVSVAIDDFGTGYASLTYLKRLPVETLKVDQSFVRDILEDPESLSILEAVLGLAHAFRREIVAEGVESVDHGLMLLHLGCELAQGYGIARPMPAQELPQWVRNWRPDPRWAEAPAVHAGNRLLLLASVEHRAWLGAFESYLQGKRHTPPPLDAQGCRLAGWLDAERQAGRDQLPTFQTIEILHEQLHGLAADILRSQASGPCSEGLARLATLHRMRDEFLDTIVSVN